MYWAFAQCLRIRPENAFSISSRSVGLHGLSVWHYVAFISTISGWYMVIVCGPRVWTGHCHISASLSAVAHSLTTVHWIDRKKAAQMNRRHCRTHYGVCTLIERKITNTLESRTEWRNGPIAANRKRKRRAWSNAPNTQSSLAAMPYALYLCRVHSIHRHTSARAHTHTHKALIQ